MNRPPAKLDGAQVEYFTQIDERHDPTDACEHTRGGVPVPGASGLAICRYDGKGEVYLFYCDQDWSVMTDTVHDTVEKARDQAEFEYRGCRDTWVQY